MTNEQIEAVVVTQADLNASADFLESWEPGPELTSDKLAMAFARHRIAAIASMEPNSN